MTEENTNTKLNPIERTDRLVSLAYCAKDITVALVAANKLDADKATEHWVNGITSGAKVVMPE